MKAKEYYYTIRQYEFAGIEPYSDHVREYIDGERTIPVTKVKSFHGNDVFFTFSNHLFGLFLNNLEKIKKPYECALKYGFRGFSKGGKNGIFFQKKDDRGLLSKTDKAIEHFHPEIVQDLDIAQDEMHSLKKVKIVYHDPSGERMVGVMNKVNNRIIFLEFANY
jgi:hypothetical protein|tara:strand:- start:195 stop:686 length:492 start_codon:yes stop_codon:yes gene_type:complete